VHLIPLFVYLALGQCLQQSRGEYHPGTLSWLVLLLTTLVAYWMGSGVREQPSWRWWLPVYALQSLSLAINPGFRSADPSTLGSAMSWILGFNGWVAVLATVCAGTRRQRWAALLVAVGLVSLLGARALTPLLSPAPFIDVYTIGTEGAARFLNGQNPYAGDYPDIYRGQYSYRPVYLYWPTGLLLQSLAYRLGDIRYAFVACDAGLSLVLVALAQGPLLQRLAMPALWLSFPVSLAVLENAWIDNFLVFFVGVTLLCLQRAQAVGAGVAMGLLCGVKQYALIFPLLYARPTLRRWGWPLTLKAGLAFVVTFVAIMAPFVVWDGEAFRRNTLDAVGQLPMRPDALTLQAWMLQVGNWRVGQGPVSLVYALVLLILLALPARLHPLYEAPALLYTVIFLAGKQAFLNYYFLLAFLILLAIFGQAERKGSADSEMNGSAARSG
jgi:hypothetical protein